METAYPQDAAETLQEILVSHFGVDAETIQPTSDFIKDLGLDSLDVIELIMLIEEDFAIDIPDEKAEKIQTVQQAIDYIDAEKGP
jgi:acyl carrier protein